MPVKRRKSAGKYIIIAASVVFLNFLGISYAQWSDQLEISGTVTTGTAAPAFCKDYNIDEVRKEEEGELLVSYQYDGSGNRVVLNVDGKVVPGYKAFVHYCVVNKGTVPLKFAGQHILENDGITLQLNQQTGILDPQERFFSLTGSPQMHVEVPNNFPDGVYSFELELPFRQWIN